VRTRSSATPLDVATMRSAAESARRIDVANIRRIQGRDQR
jgi:hypothetical protein